MSDCPEIAVVAEPVTRTMRRGDTHIIRYEVKDGDGRPYDLTGAKLWFTAKSSVHNPDAQAEIALDTAALGGVVITSALQGLARVTIPPITTRSFADGPVRLAFDFQLKDALGVIATLEFGELVVSPDVTRAIA